MFGLTLILNSCTYCHSCILSLFGYIFCVTIRYTKESTNHPLLYNSWQMGQMDETVFIKTNYYKVFDTLKQIESFVANQ